MIVLYYIKIEAAKVISKDKFEISAKRNELFLSIRKKSLVVGSHSAMDIILRWLRYGDSVNKTERKHPDFEWKNNMKVLLYKDQPVFISNLSVLATSLYQDTSNILEKYLAFGNYQVCNNADFNTLQDDSRSKAPGFSFLNHIPNKKKILCSPEIILKLALNRSEWKEIISTNQSISQAFSFKAMKTYLDNHQKFLQQLLVLCHILCGQPPRGSEILTLRIKNTATVPRNLFLIGGELVITLSYHKNQSVMRKENYIPRFLPNEIKRLILVYLFHIRPFVTILQRMTTVNSNIYESELLWANPSTGSQYWSSDQLKILLQRYSEKYIGVPLNIRSYRQMAIIIDRDIIRTPIDLQYEDGNDLSEINNNDHEGQAGHSTKTAFLHYGVIDSELESISPTLNARYQKVSHDWHNFMGFKKSSVCTGSTIILKMLILNS